MTAQKPRPPRKPGRPPGTPQGQLSARERLYRAQAEHAEIANRVRMGELLEESRVRRDNFAIARTIRDNLFNMPGRLSPEFAAETDQGTIERRMEEEIRKVLAGIEDILRGRKG